MGIEPTIFLYKLQAWKVHTDVRRSSLKMEKLRFKTIIGQQDINRISILSNIIIILLVHFGDRSLETELPVRSLLGFRTIERINGFFLISLRVYFRSNTIKSNIIKCCYIPDWKWVVVRSSSWTGWLWRICRVPVGPWRRPRSDVGGRARGPRRGSALTKLMRCRSADLGTCLP